MTQYSVGSVAQVWIAADNQGPCNGRRSTHLWELCMSENESPSQAKKPACAGFSPHPRNSQAETADG